MANVIDLLERIGSTAQSREAGSDELDRQLAAAGVDKFIWGAIIAADRRQLERLLDAPGDVCCLIDPAMEDEEDEDARRKRECEDDDAGERTVPVRDPQKVAA